MQADMQLKHHQLETELYLTRRKLEESENFLRNVNEEKLKILKEKNEMIEELHQKNEKIQLTYDSIIQLTLDSFIQNLSIKKKSWEYEGEKLQIKNKNLLAELGLKIHDI